MKVIFLDIDGVLVREHVGIGRGVDRKCVEALNRLVQESGAKIVVSSCWRLGWTVNEVCGSIHALGVEGEIIDCTGEELSTRGAEINEWLRGRAKTHADVESFVIIDDNDNQDGYVSALVQTDSKIGLTHAHVHKALEILAQSK